MIKIIKTFCIKSLSVLICLFFLGFAQKAFGLDPLLEVVFFNYQSQKAKILKKQVIPPFDPKKISGKQEPLPFHLKQYAYLLEHYQEKQFMGKSVHEYVEILKEKQIKIFPLHLLSEFSNTFYSKFKLEFDWNFKYKGIRQTKYELPPEINFEGREAFPKEGFEAGEIFKSSIPLYSEWKFFAQVGVYEKWISEKIDSEPADALNRKFLEEYENTFTSTMKYGMGVKWKYMTKKKKKMSFEALLEQKSASEWVIRQSLFSHKNSSGLLFDNWKFTFTLDF